MAAAIGVLSTFGVVLPEGAEAQSSQRTQTVEISELVGAEGEYVKADPLHAKKTDVTVTYVGEPMHASVTSAAIALPATMTIIKSDATEVNNGRVSCTVTASGHSAFTDAPGASPGVGAGDPDEDTLNIVSCSFSLAENVQVSHEVQDKMILGGNGAPGARATCLQKNSFTTRFRGDLPAGVVLGTSGAGVKGLEDGKLLVNQLMEEQKMDDFNGGSVAGNHYPLAA